ncbi:reticulon-4 isoform X1 [Acipenser oxyrinchus oxyrinchus]|uniref:Reticulon n=1 Tax=Acipenser oxyrinchus oxyrinchus TaxID=40147 RepID=A0AAD8CRF8_ACIOX|nr:reticulon-4 isoform X1 [Acipenser oxyrinchus oxyrinchus]
MPPPDKNPLPRLKTPSPPLRQRPSVCSVFLYTAVSSHCLAAEGIKGNISNKPSESVVTSLRFLSQPGSFAPVVFDSHSQALGDKNLPDPPMELKEATKIEEVPGFSTDSGIEAVSSESSRHVAPISGTEVTFRAFSNFGLSSSPDKVLEKTSDASPAMKVQERSQGVFSRGQTPEEPKVQDKPAAGSETWGDGGFMLFKECHYERSPVKESTDPFSLFNKDPSPDQDSPDSPFEVLDDSQRKHSFGKEFLETMTSDWVPTQIAAAKVVSDVEQAKDEKDQGPFGPLADIHNIEVTTNLEKTDWAKEPAYKSMQNEAKEDSDESRDSTPEPAEEEKKISPVSGGKTAPPPPPPLPPPQAKPIDTQVEEIKKQASPAKESSGEDLNFLPTAYIWEKPEKDAEKTQQTLEKSCADFENLPPPYSEVGTTTATTTSSSSSLPSYASFKFDTEELLKSQQPARAKVPGLIWGVDSEPVENIDADSSGESDDTVIEDVSVVTEREPAVPKSTATVKDPEEMEQKVAPAQLEKPLLVPIINVIETEEQIVSDDESDEKASAVVVEPADRAGKDSTPPPADTTPQDSKPAGSVLGKEDSQPTAAESKTEKPKLDSEPVLDDSESKSLTQDSESIFADSVMKTQDPKPVLADPKIEKPSSVLADFAKEKPTQDQKPILFDSETKKSTQDSQTSFEDSIMGKPTQDPKPILFDSETKISTQDSQTSFEDSIMEKPTQDPKPILFDSKIEKPLSTGVESSVESFLRGGAVRADAYEKAVQDLGEMEKEDPSKRIQPVLLAETVKAQPTSIDVSQAPFHYAQDVPTNTTSTATTVQTKSEEPVVASEEAARHLPKMSFPSGKPEDLLPGAGPADQSPARSIPPAIPKEMASRGGAEITMPVFKEELSRAEDSPDSTSDPESIEPECSVSAATDSFVDFMRECLKSRQDESPEDLSHDFAAKVSTTAAVAGSRPPQAAPTMVLDFEQEQLTIKALKELGESLEEEEEEEARNSPASKPDAQKLLLSSQAAPESFSKQQTASSPVQSHPEVAEISPSGAPREVEEASADNQRAAALTEHALAALLTQTSVRDLIYWRDVKMSGTVFGVTLLLLLSLAAFSVVSVLSYLLLALLAVTISFRVFKSVVQAVQKSDEGHPFRAYMEKDISLSSESFSRYVDTGLGHCNCVLKQLSRLFLVEDLVDSLKLAVFMWLMTYVGAVFNGITLLIIAHVLVFSIPVVYEKYKSPIDRYVGIVHNQVKSVVSKVQAKVPGLSKRKPE